MWHFCETLEIVQYSSFWTARGAWSLSDLPVLYKDERLLFVNKPSGLVVHRGLARDKITVADIVRDEIVGAKVFAIHRLDRGTSGVVGFALDASMASAMQAVLGSPETKKEYVALVRGPMDAEIDLDHPVPGSPDGDRVPARTFFRPLARAGRWSLVRAYPHTGRYHQIRRHLKHLSLPVVGDTKYGKGEVNRYFRQTLDFHRLFLHARSLMFRHPDTGKAIEVQAGLDESLTRVISELFPDLDDF